MLGDRPLTEDERRLVLRCVAVVAIPMALICMFALLVGFGIAFTNVHQAVDNAREADRKTRLLALQLNADRARQNAINSWDIYDQCVENENQDQVTADLLRKIRRQTLAAPPAPDERLREARREALDAIQTWLDAREPPGEPDCQIPPFPRPNQ